MPAICVSLTAARKVSARERDSVRQGDVNGQKHGDIPQSTCPESSGTGDSTEPNQQSAQCGCLLLGEPQRCYACASRSSEGAAHRPRSEFTACKMESEHQVESSDHPLGAPSLHVNGVVPSFNHNFSLSLAVSGSLSYGECLVAGLHGMK